MHIGVNKPLWFAFVHSKCAYRRRPDLLTTRKDLSRNNMGRSVKRSVRVILRTHFFRTDGKLSWIAGDPSVVLGDRRIGVEADVQRCQQLDHVVCHGSSDVLLMAAKRRGISSA